MDDDDLPARIESDWRTAGLDDRRLEMLDFADRLTRTPGAMQRSDVDGLLGVGYTDRDVLDIVEVVAYYAYANRIADGLGVTIEPWVEDD